VEKGGLRKIGFVSPLGLTTSYRYNAERQLLRAIRNTPYIFPDAVILSSLTASTMVTLFPKNDEKQTLCG
jgi:hypothetical protein